MYCIIVSKMFVLFLSHCFFRPYRNRVFLCFKNAGGGAGGVGGFW